MTHVTGRGETDTRDIGGALRWMVSAFQRHGVPFQVVGGLAAFAHGGRRPIVDLDFYAPLAGADDFLADIAGHTVWGPQHHRDASWDLWFMKIDHAAVRIEIGDTSRDPQFFDRVGQRWVAQHVDFGASVPRTVFGVQLPVMPLPDLLSYKAALHRAVDLVDIAELSGEPGGLPEAHPESAQA